MPRSGSQSFVVALAVLTRRARKLQFGTSAVSPPSTNVLFGPCLHHMHRISCVVTQFPLDHWHDHLVCSPEVQRRQSHGPESYLNRHLPPHIHDPARPAAHVQFSASLSVRRHAPAPHACKRQWNPHAPLKFIDCVRGTYSPRWT